MHDCREYLPKKSTRNAGFRVPYFFMNKNEKWGYLLPPPLEAPLLPLLLLPDEGALKLLEGADREGLTLGRCCLAGA